MDEVWEKVVQEVRVLLKDEDTVILPQVFGLNDASIPERIRQGIPARVVFAGTLPPSVPGIRTQMLLKKRYEVLGGTYLMGDRVTGAHVYEDTVQNVVTKHLDRHYLEADNFILASGGFFSKGLNSNPFKVYEPLFELDMDYNTDRNAWYDPSFTNHQPYLGFGVKTDAELRPSRKGVPVKNLYVIGSILGETHPELGCGAGLAIRSALKVANLITEPHAVPGVYTE
jgi:glycerol-3-phosphate dehydrogenase subunit B